MTLATATIGLVLSALIVAGRLLWLHGNARHDCFALFLLGAMVAFFLCLCAEAGAVDVKGPK